MNNLIESLKLTKDMSLAEIEGLLLQIPDFSSNYYSIKKMNCNSYAEAAEVIYNFLTNYK